MRREDQAAAGAPHDQPLRELAALRDVAVPPALVARVMTKVADGTPPSFWQWLRHPLRVELRVSPVRALALAPKYREVLILKDVEELSFEEIRSILRLPITTLKIRAVRARAMLRETLGPDGDGTVSR